MRYRAWIRMALGFSALLMTAVPAASAQDDLDVEGARRRYEAQRAVADRAEQTALLRERDYQQADSAWRQASQQEQQARQDLENAERQLDGIDREIVRIENLIRDLEREIPLDEDRIRRQEQELARLRSDKDRLMGERAALEREIARLDRAIADLQAQDPPPADRIQELTRQRNDKQRLLNQANSNISRIDSQMADLSRSLQDLARELQEKWNRLEQTRRDLDQKKRERDRVVWDVEDARDALRRAQRQLDDADRTRAEAERIWRSAQATWQAEERLAQEKWNYLQQVIANYNRERDRIFAVARQNGAADGSREAEARFSEVGTTDGDRDGTAEGRDKGTLDGKVRDFAQGYADGRTNASRDPALAAPYGEGLKEGRAWAVAKASLEDYPRGYNDAYSEAVSSRPANDVEFDITTTVPADPGGSGLDLSQAHKAPSTKHPPAFEAPAFPIVTPPTASVPSVSVPPQDGRFGAPPCTGLRLPEFTVDCNRLYQEHYTSGYGARYQSIYAANYRSAYAGSAESAYHDALEETHASERQAGLAKGAKEQGILNGFADRLAAARQEQYQKGGADFAAELSRGYLLVVRSLSFVDSDDDGVTPPGENARLTLVVDNLGAEASPKDHLRVVIAEAAKLSGLNFELRDLPAIPAGTRATLLGAVSGSVATEFAGETFGVTGRVDRKVSGSHQPLMSFDTTGTTHFPLELASITWPDRAPIGEETEAQFHFVNRSNKVQPGATLTLSSEDDDVAFPEGGTVQLEDLEPGAEASVTAKVTPSFWVGESTPVRFFSALGGSDGATVTTQAFRERVSVARDAAVKVFDRYGRPLEDTHLTVQAGSTLAIQVNMDFLANAYRRGPFVLEHWETSDRRIRHGNGSTVRINYGSWSPGTSSGNSRMYFTIPRELSGQSQWISLRMLEGRNTIHALKLRLEVE